MFLVSKFSLMGVVTTIATPVAMATKATEATIYIHLTLDVSDSVPATYHSLVPFGMNELGKYDCLGGNVAATCHK